MKKKINWYAGSEHIKWMGPYKSELEAWDAVKGLDGLPVPGSRVWCTTDTYSLKDSKCDHCGHAKHNKFKCPDESYNGYQCRCQW